jgi:hypothetical protein
MADPKIRERNKEIARNLLAAWNKQGETHLPANLISSKLITYLPGAGGRTARGARANTKVETALPAKAFREQRFSEQVLIADDEYVMIGWEVSGTHAGSLFGLAASGLTVTAPGADVFRIVDGKIVEHITYYSRTRLHALARLGLLGRRQKGLLAQKERLLTPDLLGRNRAIAKVNVAQARRLYGGIY